MSNPVFCLSTPQLNMYTLKLKYKNVNCSEEDLPFITKTNSEIVIIGSNFHKQVDPSYVIPVPKVKSNRGRKKKEMKKIPKKKLTGTGEYFPSQTTFEVLRSDGKTFKLKLFRNGSIQIPGCISEDFSEALRAARIVGDECMRALALDPEDVELVVNANNNVWDLIIFNTKTFVVGPAGLFICLTKMYQTVKRIFNSDEKLLEDDKISYCKTSCKYNEENGQDFLFKLKHDETSSEFTVTIYVSGKINVSANVFKRDFVYLWLTALFNKYGDEFVLYNEIKQVLKTKHAKKERSSRQ